MMLVALGHYQSEKCTAALLKDIITGALPECEVFVSQINTNPIRYVSPQV